MYPDFFCSCLKCDYYGYYIPASIERFNLLYRPLELMLTHQNFYVIVCNCVIY